MAETSTMKSYEEKENNKALTVKDMNPEDQPREKAEKFGCSHLTKAELWAIILRTGTPGYPVTELCHDLMETNEHSLHRLERRSRKEIMELKGIGGMKAIQIEAVMELIKRYCDEDIPPEEIITTSFQIYKRLKHHIGNLDHEQVWVVLLNRRNQVIKELQITSGTSIASLFDLKKIIRHALLERAEGIIMCHNHPSGNLRPSPQDDKITKDLAQSCKLMELNFLDHIIITHSGHYSYRDEGRL